MKTITINVIKREGRYVVTKQSESRYGVDITGRNEVIATVTELKPALMLANMLYESLAREHTRDEDVEIKMHIDLI